MAAPLVRFPRFRVTHAGWAFLALALSFGVHAILAGDNSVFLIFSLMAGLILSLAGLTIMMPIGLVARRDLPDSAHAGSDINYRLELRSTSRFGTVCSLEIRDDYAEAWAPSGGPRKAEVGAAAEIGWLEAGEAVSVPLRIPAPVRGWLTFRGLDVRRHFPFGLFEAHRYVALENRLVIYPERWVFPGQVRVEPLDGLQANSEPLGRFITSGADFAGLREFLPGDHPRQIHWHASGRFPEQILARQLEPQRDHQVAIVLDSFYRRAEEAQCRRAFEDNICLGLALCEKLLADQYEVTFAGWCDGPRVFRLSPMRGQLEGLRLWLATLQPDHEHSLPDLMARLKLPPLTTALLLRVSTNGKPGARWPISCVELAPERLKPLARVSHSEGRHMSREQVVSL